MISNPVFAAATLTTLHAFCSEAACADGSAPYGGLVQDSAGNLFGTTQSGGAHGEGVVFQLKPTVTGSWKYRVIYSFCAAAACADGSAPAGSLILDTGGNLYGTTSAGGANGGGTVFELLAGRGKSAWSEQLIYSFCATGGTGCTDGKDPQSGLGYAGAYSGLVYDGASPLYGTTFKGGEFGVYGVTYSLTPVDGSWTESVLHNFCSLQNCPDGGQSSSTPAVDASGNVFATTAFGGSNNRGVAFELSPTDDGSWTDTILYNFCSVQNCGDGGQPTSGLVIDSAGNLLGTAEGYGRDRGGTLFALTPDGTNSQLSVLHSFCRSSDCADGTLPIAGVTLDSAGTLYGTTNRGGGHDIDRFQDGGGVVFEVSGGSYKVLHRFCAKANCADGAYPPAAPVVDSAGRVFGVTQSGGRQDAGSVFVLTRRF